ncbi:MAG: hypothetical protein FWD36_04860 [Treponema sp.]|nr:hypothetical protein [Treponema sp.]
MKRLYMIFIIFFTLGVYSVTAMDQINLIGGGSLLGKVYEISSSHIKYKVHHHLDGPMCYIQANDVHSIIYGNGTLEKISQKEQIRQEKMARPERHTDSRRQSREKVSVPQLGEPNLMQQALNLLPTVPIAGNNLKFEFGGDTWIAKVNGNNFLAGNCIFEKNDNGYFIKLNTTNVWSGAVVEVIDLLKNIGVPLGPAEGPLKTAAILAARIAKWMPLKGPAINLEYNEGPPALIKLSS